MRHINPFRAGVAVGVVISLWHLIWVVLVAIGWAKPILEFILRLHFIRLPFELAPFALDTAAMLLALTFTIGAVFGIVFALVWNWLAGGSGEAVQIRRKPARV